MLCQAMAVRRRVDMTQQPTLFEIHGQERAAPLPPPKPLADPQEGDKRKREGMQRAASSKPNQLGYARELALDLARSNGGECHADMVAEALAKEGRPSLGNAAGSVFLPSVWEDTGKVFKSERPEAHRNKLVVWRLRYA
jgi:hypothetical protein